MSRPVFTLSLVLLLLPHVEALEAQGLPQLEPGWRIRVTTDSGARRMIARFVGQDGNAVQVRVPAWAVTGNPGDRDSSSSQFPGVTSAPSR